MRKLLLMAGVMLAAATLAPAALAARPSIGPVAPFSADFAAGDLCPFGVSIRTVETKQFGITFSDGMSSPMALSSSA